MIVGEYLMCCFLLGSIAVARARRFCDTLKPQVAVVAVSAGLLVTLVDETHHRGGVSIALILAVLTISSWTDLSNGYLYDAVLLVAATAAFAIAIVSGGIVGAVLAAAVALTIGLALWMLSSRRGLGLGDVKLFAVLGAACASVPVAVESMAASFVLGAIVMVPAMLLRRIKRSDRIAFAPFIAISTACVVLSGAAR